jgi:glycosyltransferase involved in cell wall biosynthesis
MPNHPPSAISHPDSCDVSAARLPHPVRITEQVWPEGTVPVVTIKCITYQHVNFIRDAIEGFLMQETTFPVEILVHDDASTDGTADIVREYQGKYPQLFRTVLQTENQYSQGKKAGMFLNAMVRGEFIALCEGDDYWIAKSKLQRQIDVLESRPDVALVFHNAWVRHEESRKDFFLARELKGSTFGVQDLISRDWFVPTASIVHRSSLKLNTDLLSISFAGDVVILLSASLQGSLHYIDEVGSVYRKHSGGLSKKLTGSETLFYEKLRTNQIWLLTALRNELPRQEFGEILDKRIQQLIGSIARHKVSSAADVSRRTLAETHGAVSHLLETTRPKAVGTDIPYNPSLLDDLTGLAVRTAVADQCTEAVLAKARRHDLVGTLETLCTALSSGSLKPLRQCRLLWQAAVIYLNTLLGNRT